MRVLQLISSGGYYGAENMLLNLAQSQKSIGCDPCLLLFYNVHQPNVELYERAAAAASAYACCAVRSRRPARHSGDPGIYSHGAGGSYPHARLQG